jgi:hypothetical protein
MKIEDNTGRSMLVDLVHKDDKFGWLQASTYTLKGRSTIYAQVPHGKYAVRVCSLTGADVLLFENGQKLIQTTVPARTQFIEFDAQGNALCFKGSNDQPQSRTDQSSHAAVESDPEIESTKLEFDYNSPAPPAGAGLVFAILRFAKQNLPHGEPPQMEHEIAIQMLAPDDFAQHFASNARLVDEPPALPNPRDEFSREASAEPQTHIHCTFSGCNH